MMHFVIGVIAQLTEREAARLAAEANALEDNSNVKTEPKTQ